jgi:3-phenylpropionate/trans-cinnamate dioxygenase ferredoxin reductase subunit
MPGMVIVGAGKAAAGAIVALREHGWTGSITLIGEETYAPYDRPPLSKSSITSAHEPEPAFILDTALLNSLGVTFYAGKPAVAIDRTEKFVLVKGGERIPFHKLLIATGARARQLPVKGSGSIRTLRSLPDSTDLRNAFIPGRQVAIIGGGFIGLELAAAARRRGCVVTVVEAQPRLLTRGVPASIAAKVAERHSREGVTILTGAQIEQRDTDAVILGNGRRIPADVVVAGVGAVPETALAQSAGLLIDDGIACNAEMRTSDPDIFAAGDCCSFPHSLYGHARIRLEAWRAAQQQGAVAAENMLGGKRLYDQVPWFWSDQYDLTLQIAGLPIAVAKTATRQLKQDAFIDFAFDADGRLICASGIGPGNTIARDIRMSEMLIAKGSIVDPAALSDPATALKSLLAG